MRAWKPAMSLRPVCACIAAALFLCLDPSRPLLSQEGAAPPAIEAPATPEQEPDFAELGLREVVARLIKLSEKGWYLDAGTDDGLDAGMTVKVFREEAVSDLEGKLLAVERARVGALRIVEAKASYSIGLTTNPEMELQKGDLATFNIPIGPEPEPQTASREKTTPPLCREGMIFYEGGQFAYTPVGLNVNEAGKEETAAADPFCVGAEQADRRPLQWMEARNECEKAGLRLCMKDEIRFLCAGLPEGRIELHQTEESAAASAGRTPSDLGKAYEWTGDWTESGDEFFLGAGSCRCAGKAVSCTECLHAGCPGIHKMFRCCANPLPAAPAPSPPGG